VQKIIARCIFVIIFSFLQELLYCETCDQVFCSVCTKHDDLKPVGNSPISPKSLPIVHTIVPVSVAIKRTSEIMLYKANECVSKVGLTNYINYYYYRLCINHV